MGRGGQLSIYTCLLSIHLKHVHLSFVQKYLEPIHFNSLNGSHAMIAITDSRLLRPNLIDRNICSSGWRSSSLAKHQSAYAPEASWRLDVHGIPQC